MKVIENFVSLEKLYAESEDFRNNKGNCRISYSLKFLLQASVHKSYLDAYESANDLAVSKLTLCELFEVLNSRQLAPYSAQNLITSPDAFVEFRS